MTLKALFIGSIGVVTETSEYQRRAYNQALAEHGMNWEWTPEIYQELLKSNGGQQRLHLLSTATQQPLATSLIEKIHARKTELAAQMIQQDQLSPRPGVVALIQAAKQAGMTVAWVTSTFEENTQAILAASNGQLSADDFDHIFHRKDAVQGKPAPDIYHTALAHFGLAPEECIAVEDSLISLLAAKSAGLFTVATLGAYHNEQVDNIADLVFKGLDETSWTQLAQRFEAAHTPVV